MWLAGGFLSAVPGGKSMRPPPVILKGIHSNEPKWNRGPPTFGARGVRLGSQLPTISAIAAVAVSPASNLGLDITPASVSEDFATPHDGWKETYATLHMWTQVVGKLALKLSPLTNHYWNTALQVTPRGVATLPLTADRRSVTISFDFVAHQLVLECSDGKRTTVSLEPRSVAEFYHLVTAALTRLDIPARIWTMPVEVPNPIRFEADTIHRSYDPAPVQACWQVLVQTKRVLEQFRSRFLGKTSPVHFWWGSFDLAHTRFSGRPAPRHPGGIPNLADAVTREAYSHECISIGWWPGGGLAPILEPAFY